MATEVSHGPIVDVYPGSKTSKSSNKGGTADEGNLSNRGSG